MDYWLMLVALVVLILPIAGYHLGRMRAKAMEKRAARWINAWVHFTKTVMHVDWSQLMTIRQSLESIFEVEDEDQMMLLQLLDGNMSAKQSIFQFNPTSILEDHEAETMINDASDEITDLYKDKRFARLIDKNVD